MRNYAILRQPASTLLAVGAAIGLILGLLIGWVFWPVQWEGATLRDLYPSEKAEYIAAVADAFVIYDSPEAAEVAQRRLAAIDDGSLAQAFQDALSYFGASTYSDKAIRDSNIRRLAVALNMAPPAIAVDPQVQTSSSEANATSAMLVTTPSTTTDTASSGLGWAGWVLWFLTAVLLLAGGLYILRKAGPFDFQALLKSRTPATNDTADDIDEFEEPSAQQRRGQRAQLVSPRPMSSADYPFDQEDDEWPAPTDARTQRGIASRYSTADNFDEDALTDDDLTDDGYLEDADDDLPFDEEDDGPDWRPPGKSYTIDIAQEENPAASNAAAYGLPPATPDAHARSRDADIDIDADLAQSDEQQPRAALSMAVAPRPATPTPRRANSQSGERTPLTARARSRVIDQHVFHYQMGMMEYDESRPIVDPQSGKYIGEFGMGASDKNALMQTGPHQLVALEVWIFDKSDERSLGNQTRILLSEYAVDHNLEQMFLKERQDNPRPFTAQPGVHFQLESQNLLLDCTIVDVVYSASNATKGIFQEITVDMSVQQKGA